MKKKQKKKEQARSIIKAELLGLLFIVLSIIMFFGLGILGRILNSVGLFFFGYSAYLLYVLLFLKGIATVVGRKLHIESFSKKMALIIFTVCVLMITSLIFYDKDYGFFEYVSDLFNGVINYVKDGNIDNIYGGLFGYALTYFLITLVTRIGVVIICVAGILGSVVIFFQKPLKDYFKSSRNEKKQKPKEEKKISKIRKKVGNKPKKSMEIFDYEDAVKEEKPVDKNQAEPKKSMAIFNYEDTAKEEKPVSDNKKVDKKPVVKSGGKYTLPPLNLLADNTSKNSSEEKSEIKHKAKVLVQTLKEFNVHASVVAVHVGPTVTQFEIEIKAGTKLSKVKNLSGELALALAAKDVRIQAPIPQKGTVGVEIPNVSASLVTLKEIIRAIPKAEDNKTVFALGKDIMGKPIYAALNKMPHMLVAGATGSGKSVCINSIIISIAMRAKPSEVKMLMIDPKKVELSGYNGLPHLMAPVVTNPKKAATALQRIVDEMERRYDLFSDSGSKNIDSFNDKMKRSNLEKSMLPYIVVIVDELADLMLVASKEVEDSIMRITQMARAAGIHLIVATQRPSTDIITGVIKSNIPSRIAFGVSSSIDSRTILDSTGAEKLLGKGDMLFVPMGSNHPTRIQGAFLSEREVEDIVYYCSEQQKAQFDEKLVDLDEKQSTSDGGSDDDLYSEVLEFVIEHGSASTSLLQRRFRIGYNRASRLIDDLEANGIVGPQNGSKPREIITDEIL